MMKYTFCKCDKCGTEALILPTTRLPNVYWAQLETLDSPKIYDLCPECKSKIINLIETHEK